MILSLLIGAALGTIWALALARFAPAGKRPPSAWQRSALYGGMIGLCLHSFSGGTYHPPKNVKLITGVTFNAEVRRSELPIVVDFYAPWCGPCKKLSPILSELATEFSGQIKFLSVNIDEDPALAEKFKVQGIPTLLFLDREGHQVDAMVGLSKSGELRERLQKLVTRTSPFSTTSNGNSGKQTSAHAAG